MWSQQKLYWFGLIMTDGVMDLYGFVSGHGHYIQMRRNSARQGMSARFQSTRLLLNDSCLAFYYNIQGRDASIKVIIINEVGVSCYLKLSDQNSLGDLLPTYTNTL